MEEYNSVRAEAPNFHDQRGLSFLNKPAGRNQISKTVPFNGYGRTDPGTAIHNFYQKEVFPEGKHFKNGYKNVCEEPFLVIGHEQKVIVITKDGSLFVSSIDTVVYLTKRKVFEFWDYKSTQAWKLELLDEKDIHQGYMDQVNFYCYADKNFKAQSYRIIYVNKGNWESCYAFVYDRDKEIFDRGLIKLKMELNTKDYKWSELTEECLNGTYYKKKCPEYCNNPKECLNRFNNQFNEDFADHKEVRKYMKEKKKDVK